MIIDNTYYDSITIIAKYVTIWECTLLLTLSPDYNTASVISNIIHTIPDFAFDLKFVEIDCDS